MLTPVRDALEDPPEGHSLFVVASHTGHPIPIAFLFGGVVPGVIGDMCDTGTVPVAWLGTALAQAMFSILGAHIPKEGPPKNA